MLLVDEFLIPQDLYESEDELLSLKTQSLVSTKLHLVPMCDVSPIQPRKLREAEHLKLGFDMEKLLLERVVLRKELKLQRMQEKLFDLKEKLKGADERLMVYEDLHGMFLVRAITKVVYLCGKTCSSLQAVAELFLVRLYQVFFFP